METETKKKYASIFAQIKAEHQEDTHKSKTRDSDVLVVDGTNNFIRCWTVVPTLNDNGEHVGGVTGFLTSLGYAIKLLRPTRVIVVFDGKGGSDRRKKLFPEYKNKRKVCFRINRAYDGMVDPDKEHVDMIKQMGMLTDYLTSLPVSLVSVDYIEADDAIAYISTQMFLTSKITIMSADRDFMQLVNSRVSIWSPIKKKIYGVQDVINEYGVHPHNFVFYRILDGDASDNIDGIKGLALKTILKLYPEIKEETEFSVDRLLGLAKDKLNEKPMYAKIVENSTVVSRNYMLMQLKEPNFTPSLQLQVSREVERLFDYNKFQFIQKMTASGMHTTIPNYHVWLQEVFYPLSVFATSK